MLKKIEDKVPFLYFLETSENQRFFKVFEGVERMLAWMG